MGPSKKYFKLMISHEILQRRVAWIIGCWIHVKPKKDIRPDIYSLLITLMNPDRHIVVRLTAVASLKSCVDEWDFPIDTFIPYMEPILSQFTQLLRHVDEYESKMKIVNCLSVIVERLEKKVILTLWFMIRFFLLLFVLQSYCLVYGQKPMVNTCFNLLYWSFWTN